MRRVRFAALVVASIVIAFALVTWVALEGREVVVVRMHAADGPAHATRT